MVELTDLRIKKELLDGLVLPISIKMGTERNKLRPFFLLAPWASTPSNLLSFFVDCILRLLGYVGRLRIEVPWSRMWSGQLKIVAEDVLMITGPIHKDNFDADQEMARLSRLKQKTIIGAELYQQALEEAEAEGLAQLSALPGGVSQKEAEQKIAESNGETTLETFISSLIRNALVEIKRLHIRYEDGESAPGRSLALGVTLSSLSIRTNGDDSQYSEQFAESARLLAQELIKTVAKAAEDTDAASQAQKTSETNVGATNIVNQASEVVSELLGGSTEENKISGKLKTFSDASSDDDSGDPLNSFVELIKSNLSTIFKTVSINHLAVYFNSKDVLFLPKKTTQESLTIQESMPDTHMSAPIPIKLPSETTTEKDAIASKLDPLSRQDETPSEPIATAPFVPESSVERIIRSMLSMIPKEEDDKRAVKRGSPNLQFLVRPFSLDIMLKTHARVASQPIFSEPNLSLIVTMKDSDTLSKQEKVDILESGNVAHINPDDPDPSLLMESSASSMNLSVPGDAKKSQSKDEKEASGKATLKSPSIELQIDQDQLAAFGSISTTLSGLAVKRRFGQFRPRVSASENPRAWWLFLRQSLFHDIQEEKRKRTMEYLDRRRVMRIKYVSLYREKILRAWGFDHDPIPKVVAGSHVSPNVESSSRNDASETDSKQNQPSIQTIQKFSTDDTYLEYQLVSMEDRLDADDIIFFRAYARMQIESEGLVKPPSVKSTVVATSSKTKPKTKSLFSRVLPWFGVGGNKELKAAMAANSDPSKFRNSNSEYHISRLEDDKPLPHDMPWAHKLRLAVDSSNPNSSWASQYHSEFSQRIDPKYRRVHPDYAQIAGHVSLPSIQLTLMHLLPPTDPQEKKESDKLEEDNIDGASDASKPSAPVSTQAPVFTPAHFILAGPQFTITHSRRIPLGRIELQGIQAGFEVKPTHGSTSLRVALASISVADLTRPERPTQMVRFRPSKFDSTNRSNGDSEGGSLPNLIDLSLETNPYSPQDGHRLPFDMAIAAKVRRLELLPNLDFVATLANTFATSSSHSFGKVIQAAKTLEKLKKVTRRSYRPGSSSIPSRGAALLIDASVDLPLIALTTHPSFAFSDKPVSVGKNSASSSRLHINPNASTPVLLLDLGRIDVKSGITFPDMPPILNHTTFGAPTANQTATWESPHTQEDDHFMDTPKLAQVRTKLAGATSVRAARKILSETFGPVPMHLVDRWVNSLFASWEGLSAQMADLPVAHGQDAKSEQKFADALDELIASQPSMNSLQRISELNHLHTCFRYATNTVQSKAALRYLIVPSMPTRVAVKITSNPLMFLREAARALSHNRRRLAKHGLVNNATIDDSKLTNPPSVISSHSASSSSSSSSSTAKEEEALASSTSTLEQVMESMKKKALAKTEVNACVARISLQLDPHILQSLMTLIKNVKPVAPPPAAAAAQKKKVTVVVPEHRDIAVPQGKVIISDATIVNNQLNNPLIAPSAASDGGKKNAEKLVASNVARILRSPLEDALQVSPSIQSLMFDDFISASLGGRANMSTADALRYSDSLSTSTSSLSSTTDSEYQDAEDDDGSEMVPQIVVAQPELVDTSSIPDAEKELTEEEEKKLEEKKARKEAKSARRRTKVRKWLASNMSLKLLLRGLSVLIFDKESSVPPIEANYGHGRFAAMGISLIDVRASFSAQSEVNNEIRSSIGSLIVYAPSKLPGTAQLAFPFATTVPQGRFQTNGWEKDWTRQSSSAPSSPSPSEWLSVCFREAELSKLHAKTSATRSAADEKEIFLWTPVSRDVLPILAVGSCAYGLPASAFLDPGKSTHADVRQGEDGTFWKLSSFCAISPSYDSNGSEKLLSLSIDVDNSDAISPLTLIKAHLGPFVLAPSIAIVSALVADTIPSYLECFKPSGKKSTRPKESEKNEDSKKSSSKSSESDPTTSNWLETSPGLQIALSWTGLAVIVPHTTEKGVSNSKRSTAPLLALSLSRVRANVNLISNKQDMKLSATLGSLDLQIDNSHFSSASKFPLDVYPFPLPRSIISVREYMEPKKQGTQGTQGRKTFVKSGDSSRYGPPMASRNHFLTLQVVSRAHYVKQAHSKSRKRRGSVSSEETDLGASTTPHYSAVDAQKLQQFVKESEEASNLAQEGPWKTKISAKLSRLSICASPALALAFMDTAKHSMQYVDQMKKALKSRDKKEEKVTFSSSDEEARPCEASDESKGSKSDTNDKPKNSDFSIPKINVRLELPELIVPFSEISAFEHVTSAMVLPHRLRNGVGRGLLLQLGSIHATDGYSNAAKEMNSGYDDAHQAGVASRAKNSTSTNSFDLHFMASWHGINLSLAYLVQEIEDGVVTRLCPLSLEESPYTADYTLMDSIIMQQAPIILHLAQQGFFNGIEQQDPSIPAPPPPQDSSLPEYVLESIKTRVEARVGQLRIRLADHILQAISEIVQTRLLPFVSHVKTISEPLTSKSQTSTPDKSEDAGDISNAPKEEQKNSKQSAGQPFFASARLLLVSVEFYKSIYGPSSSFVKNAVLFSHTKDLVTSLNSETNPRPISMAKIATLSIADVNAVVCLFKDQHSPSACSHRLIDANIGGINLILAAHRLNDFVFKSISSVQAKYIAHMLQSTSIASNSAFATNLTSNLATSTTPQSPSAGRRAHHIFNPNFQTDDASYASLSSLSPLIAWSSYTVPGQFEGYAPENCEIPGLSFLSKSTILAPPAVQILGQRSLIYSNELEHERPSYPLIKIHFLTTATDFAKLEQNSSRPPASQSREDDFSGDDSVCTEPEPVIDPLLAASSSSTWVHPRVKKNLPSAREPLPNLSSSSHYEIPSDDGDSNGVDEIRSQGIHTEMQATIEMDHLLAVANVECLTHLLQHVEESILPIIPKNLDQSEKKKEQKDENTKKKTEPEPVKSNKSLDSSHIRVITRLSLLSVQIPATSRLPIESSANPDKMTSIRSDPPRSVVPSIVLEFAVDLEASVLQKAAKKTFGHAKSAKNAKKPSIKSSVLLHSLQLYRTAYGQSSAATGVSAAVSKPAESTTVSMASRLSSLGAMSTSTASNAQENAPINAVLQSPALQSTPVSPQGARKASKPQKSSYSHSFGTIGQLFTQPVTPKSQAKEKAQENTAEPVGATQSSWPPQNPGRLGWRSSHPSTGSQKPSTSSTLGGNLPYGLHGHGEMPAASKNAAISNSQPHLSRLSKVPLLDPVSISCQVNILPSGSTDASVLAEPLYLKVSNRDALAALAIVKSILGSSLLPTITKITSSLETSSSTASKGAKSKTKQEGKSKSKSSASAGDSLRPVSKMVKVFLGGLHLLVLEDSAKGSVGVGAETPILNVQLQSVLAEVHMTSMLVENESNDASQPISFATTGSSLKRQWWKDEIVAIASFELKAGYYDSRGAFWETLVDPWPLHVHFEQKALKEVEEEVQNDENEGEKFEAYLLRSTNSSRRSFIAKIGTEKTPTMNIWVRAPQRIETTVTSELLKILQKSKLKWNLSEWRLALESYSPYTKDANAGAQRSLDFDARKSKRSSTSFLTGLPSEQLVNSDAQSLSALLSRGSSLASAVKPRIGGTSSGLSTPSLLSSLSGGVTGSSSAIRTPGGLDSRLNTNPPQQVVLVNKTGLPLSFALSSALSAPHLQSTQSSAASNAASSSHAPVSHGDGASIPSSTGAAANSFSKGLDLGANAHVLSIDSQITLDPDELLVTSHPLTNLAHLAANMAHQGPLDSLMFPANAAAAAAAAAGGSHVHAHLVSHNSNSMVTASTLSLQFGTYNAVFGIPIFEGGSSASAASHGATSSSSSSLGSQPLRHSSNVPSSQASAHGTSNVRNLNFSSGASFTPLTGVRFFQINRSLARESEASATAPSNANEGEKRTNSAEHNLSVDSHILVVEYSTIDLSTFITVRGTAIFVNDCRTKNVRIGHSKLRSIQEHHLLPAGSSWPIPFQWLDEGLLNDLLYAHHLSQIERRLDKIRRTRNANNSMSAFKELAAQAYAHIMPPPPSKSQLTIDFQILTPQMLLGMMTAKGQDPHRPSAASISTTPPLRRGASESAGTSSSSSASHTALSSLSPPPFSLSVHYQTSCNDEMLSTFRSSLANSDTSSFVSNVNAKKRNRNIGGRDHNVAGITSKELEEVSCLLPDFGASSLPLSIHVRPALVLENLLPVPIDIRVLDRETAKIIVQENSVPMGKQVEVFYDMMHHPLLLSIRFPPSQHWSDDYLVNTNRASKAWNLNSSFSASSGSSRPDSPPLMKSKQPRQLIHASSTDEGGDEALADSILVRDDFDARTSRSGTAKTHVLLDYKRPQLYALHISLYASFWIENKTGLPLQFAFTDQPLATRSTSSTSSTSTNNANNSDEEVDELQSTNEISNLQSSSTGPRDIPPSDSITNPLPSHTSLNTSTTFGSGSASKSRKSSPSPSALLPHQQSMRHLGGIENVYSKDADELSMAIDASLVRPLFASFAASPASSLAFFAHWIRRPPSKPSKDDPSRLQEDLEGRNLHWSDPIDFSAFLPSNLRMQKPDLSTPIHLTIPYSNNLSIHLAITVERCTGAFWKTFKLSVTPRLFVTNASSLGIESTFTFSSLSDAHHLNSTSETGSNLFSSITSLGITTGGLNLMQDSVSPPSSSQASLNASSIHHHTPGDPEREISVSIFSTGPGQASLPVYLLPTNDIRFEDLSVQCRLRASMPESQQTQYSPIPFSTPPITLNGAQSHLLNLQSHELGQVLVRGMARLEMARIEAVSGSGVHSSYLLAVSTSSSFFEQPFIQTTTIDSGAASSSSATDNLAENENSPESALSPNSPHSSLAFQLCPYWINNNTAYWIKVMQSEPKPSKKNSKSLSAHQPCSSVTIAPHSSSPFTWDYPEMAHTAEVYVWTATGLAPPENLESLSSTPTSSSGWLHVNNNLDMDATFLQIPVSVDRMSEQGGKARSKILRLSDVPAAKSGMVKTSHSGTKALLGLEVLVSGPRRHFNVWNLVENDFRTLAQLTEPQGSPSAVFSNNKKPNINILAFIGGLGVSVVHSKKRVLSPFQRRPYTTTSAIEDSAELLYLVIADINADVCMKNSGALELEVRIESIQLDCPDHAKLNTPHPVIVTSMLDDVSDSNTGTTDFSFTSEAVPSDALKLKLRLPPKHAPTSPHPQQTSQKSSLSQKTKRGAHSSSSISSATRIDFVSLQLRPLTICLDQSFLEILLDFATDSIVHSSASSAAAAARNAKYKKIGIPANISTHLGDGLGSSAGMNGTSNRYMHLDASQLTYGITSAVPEILAENFLSSATLAMASTDAQQLISSGLALFKKPMLIGELVMHPVVLKLTLTTNASKSSSTSGYDASRSSIFDMVHVNRLIRAIGVGTVGVDGLKLRFGSAGLMRVLVTPKELAKMIVKTYQYGAILQVLKITGTLNFTGSPLIIVENLMEGLVDLVRDPMRPNAEHGGYLTGAVHGAQNLVIKSIFGFTTSASNMSSSIAKFLSVLIDPTTPNSVKHSITNSSHDASTTFAANNTLSASNVGKSSGSISNSTNSSSNLSSKNASGQTLDNGFGDGGSSLVAVHLRSSASPYSSAHLVNSAVGDAQGTTAEYYSWNSVWEEEDDGNDVLDDEEEAIWHFENGSDLTASRLGMTSSSSKFQATSSTSSFSGNRRLFENAPGAMNSGISSSESLLASSVVSLGKSLLGGATGLVMDPIRGWKRNGARGAIRGFARGVAGLALKPSLAVAQIIQGTADHLKLPAQRAPPSLVRAPRIPKSFNFASSSSSSSGSGSHTDDSYTSSLLSITANPSVGPFSGAANSNLNSNSDSGVSSAQGANNALTESHLVTAHILTYLLTSSTTSPSRLWDCYDAQASIGHFLLSKVSREKYNAEVNYWGRYGNVSLLGNYVHHWFLPATPAAANHNVSNSKAVKNVREHDTYWILTTRCFIKVVPASSGVPFDSSLNRIGQISLLSTSPLDIRYVLIRSDVASVSFEKPGSSNQASPQYPIMHAREEESSGLPHCVYLHLNRPYSASVDANGSDWAQFADDDDEVPKKWFRKVKLRSFEEAQQLALLLPNHR